MTNPTLPDDGRIEGSVLSLAHTGGKRRPVKVVEHPTFRVARRRLAMDAPFTVLRVPMVSLDPLPVFARYHAARVPTTTEAA
jgi:hypothetical protein